MKEKKMSVEAAAKAWIELKAAEEAIASRRAELKEILEPALEAAPEQALELNGWKFLLSEFERESFSLAKAKEKIDGRVLSPYITVSKVRQIRTTWKGGTERKAA